MKMLAAVGAVAALVVFGLATAAQTQVVIYDPSAKFTGPTHNEGDERFVKDRLLPKALEKWSEKDYCSGSELDIIGAVDGAFTRSGAAQRVVVYELCQPGNGFANNGVAVIERGRVVAHFAVEGGWNLDVSRVPDINRNGRDEIALETGGGMHQGYTGSSVTILEMSETVAVELGVFVVFTNECDPPVSEKYCDRNYRLTAAPGAKPAFFRQKYVNRGTDQKPRWVASGKPAAAKTVGDLNRKYELFER